ncbi:lipopolysaccharide O-acetyltransferase [Myxococcaceae bacterium]|jgi:hypothetical protein|nr:lipopolysaccharide O-acetyltransferase [Myxococcaceae bacterium]
MSELLARLRGSLFRLRIALTRPSARVGRGLLLHAKLDLRGPGRIEIGDDCRVAGVPGDRRPHVVIDARNPDSVVRIGRSARLYAARITARWSVEIGDEVLIEEAAVFDTAFHSLEPDREDPAGESLETSRIVIGERVSIGARSLVLRGTRIGDGAVVGPGAVLARPLPAGWIAFGNPARVSESGS